MQNTGQPFIILQMDLNVSLRLQMFHWNLFKNYISITAKSLATMQSQS